MTSATISHSGLSRRRCTGVRAPGRLARWILAAVILFGLAGAPLPAEAVRTSDRIIAIVNEEVITLSEMRTEIRGEEARLRQQYEGAELDRQWQMLQYKALTRLIERKLQLQVAREMGYLASDEEVRAAVQRIQRSGENIDDEDPELIESVKEQLTVMKVLEREVQSGVMVSEDDLRRYYDDHRSMFMLPIEYRLSQILIRQRDDEPESETRGRALQVYKALKMGADFAELARRQSDGQEAVQGGSLGIVHESELEEPIAKAISKLNPGDVCQPVITDDGFHIVRVDDRSPPKFQQYAAVKAEIHNLVYTEKSEDQYHKWIDELKDKAYIELKY